MYNWNVDLTRLKQDPPSFDKFVLEQQINFGLNGTKISRAKLTKYLPKLDIDPQKRKFLEKIIWAKS